MEIPVSQNFNMFVDEWTSGNESSVNGKYEDYYFFFQTMQGTLYNTLYLAFNSNVLYVLFVFLVVHLAGRSENWEISKFCHALYSGCLVIIVVCVIMYSNNDINYYLIKGSKQNIFNVSCKLQKYHTLCIFYLLMSFHV